jgi:hypothetical protein
MSDENGVWRIDTFWSFAPTLRIEPDDKQWHDFEVQTAEIPAGNWDVTIRFLVFQDVDYAYWDNVTFEFQGGLVESQDLVIINAANLYGDTSSDVTLHLVDSNVINSQALDKNALSLTGEAVADTWQSHAGSAEQELYLICEDNYKANYINPKRTYQGVLKGQFDYSFLLDDGDLIYYPANVRYNIKESTWDGEWVNMPILWEEVPATFANGIAAANLYDSFSTSTNSVDIEKTQTIAAAYVAATLSTEVGRRYKLNINITRNTPGFIPDFTFCGVSKSDFVDGDNEWELIALSAQGSSDVFISNGPGDTTDTSIIVFIYEIVGG